MRASRLLSLLLLLQTRGRMTAPELARELEVSVRTVYRDVESLSAAGVPVYADRGPAGGYQLLGGFRTKLTGLTGDEAESLFAGIPDDAAAELGLGSVLAAAQVKLLAALPPELRSRAGRIRERFHLDAPNWFREVERPEHLAALAEAVWNQQLVEARYEPWGRDEVTRALEPYGLVLKTGVWYVAARVDGAFRSYRVGRIRALTLRPDRFERAADFDLAAYWAAWAEDYRARLFRSEAVVRLSPLARDLVPYYLGPHAARALRETAGPPDEYGWVRATLPIETPTHARMEFFRFGPDLEVLEPPELRDLMVRSAAEVTRLYADGPREPVGPAAEDP
ncbi:helix-turn-helix transcriptional regulator [Actinopolymorpha singaporensis]|uniref:helix-turn-helix transcriptional regulator n=1 Tax=Actinopolymorpha singaporensis TaxID=117157 RepID=UPI000B84E2A3|nr:WYL domain-containing protein [Actinopolymorpha singaporensis]